MLRRIFTTALAVTLVCSAGLPAFANTPRGANADGGAALVPAEPGAGSRKDAARGEKLKGDFVGLVADARAGKVGTTVRPRQQPAQSNNLSKGAKITIGVVVAAVVITAIVVAAKANNGPGGSIRIF